MGLSRKSVKQRIPQPWAIKISGTPILKIRSWITLLPYHWKSPWFDQKIRINDFNNASVNLPRTLASKSWTKLGKGEACIENTMYLRRDVHRSIHDCARVNNIMSINKHLSQKK